MNNKSDKKNGLEGLQTNADYVILSNPLASPKFVRVMGKGKTQAINEVYTPKIFYEIVSKLMPEHLEGVKRNENISFDIKIKDFLIDIGGNPKNYKHLIDSIEIMQSTVIKWKEGDETISVPIVSKSIHNEKTGRVQLFVDIDLANRILEVKKDGNFSFLKSNVFKLQNAQAIKLYPFFKSWLNIGNFKTDVEKFKEKFGYNTKGYTRFALFSKYVLIPAIAEINEKTDMNITYELVGQNLDGTRPRVTGLIFVLKSKYKMPNLLEDEVDIVAEKPLTSLSVSRKKVGNYTELYSLFNKIRLTEKPTESICEVLVDDLVAVNGFDVVKDCFSYLIDHKVAVRSVTFFNTTHIFEEHTGYLQRKKQKLAEKQQKETAKAEALKAQKQLTLLIESFKEREYNYFVRMYDGQIEAYQQALIAEMMEKNSTGKLYFDVNNKPTILAKYLMGKALSYRNNYDRLAKFKGLIEQGEISVEITDEVLKMLEY